MKNPFFKLICGASLLDLAEIEFLSAVYAEAGAGIIDLAAHPDAVRAAIRGMKNISSKPLLMVSVAVGDDPHLLVAEKNELSCLHCGLCDEACPVGSDQQSRCCGCGKCVELCPGRAISLRRKEWAVDLDSCWEAGARGLELHTGGGDPASIENWKVFSQAWVEKGGFFSVSVNNRQLDIPKAVAIALEVRSWFDCPILVQTDGNPISGKQGESSTLPALILAREILASGIDALIQPAGGANDQTARLAAQMEIPISGVGMGSYARNAVRGKSYELALLEARSLVASVGASDSSFERPSQAPRRKTSPSASMRPPV